MPHDQTSHAQFIKDRKEVLNQNWIRVASLNNNVVIWKSDENFSILATRVPVLVCNDQEFTHQDDVFSEKAIAKEWTWDGRRIYITLQNGESPGKGACKLNYAADAGKPLTMRQESLNKNSVQQSFQFGSKSMSVYRTQHSLLPCKQGGIVLKDGIKQVPYSSDVLNDSIQTPEWSYLEPASFLLFERDRSDPFIMYGRKETFTNTRYYTSGFIRWRFLAAGILAGKQFPRMIIFLDDRKIGAIRIRDREYQTYDIQTFLPQGLHTIRAQFVNDFYNQQMKRDRNIMILKVEVQHIGSLLISSSANSNFSIQYCTTDGIEPFSGNADVKGYVQKSLFLPAASSISFNLRLPKNPRLFFSMTSFSNEDSPKSEVGLKIHVKPLFQEPKEVFYDKVPANSGWGRQTIDLNAYSGKSITLKFESKTETKYLTESPTLAVSNPTITSNKAFSEKQIRHIFIITADALRADHLGCYGYKRPTSPSLDLFSKDSVLFENAISQGAATLPSTASLFTSVYPSAHKTDVNNSKLPEIFLTLPEMMTANGYLTSGFVQNEFLNPPHGLADGFSWYLYDKFGYHTEQRLIPALQWITDMRDLPTFSFFHMLHPHSPYIPPPDIANLFQVSLSPLASSNQKLLEMDSKRILLSKEEREQLITLYDGEIRHLDRIFASFIERLKQLHIYDESLIIFLSDHGESFQEHGRWGHGFTVYQDTIHVPLLIKFPASYKNQGLRISQYVQTMDLMPTILELIGGPQPGFLQGLSLLPVINRTRNTDKTRSIFCEVLTEQLLAVIKEGFKYVYSGRTQQEELYDLNADSGETVDLSQKRPDLMKKFRMERTGFFQRASEWRLKHLKGNEGEHITLDENQTEELRALGYIQ